MNGGDCGSQTSRAAGTIAPMLCRQPPGSVNISRVHWSKGNLLKIIRPLPPAAVSCRTQPPAPNSACGSGPQRGPCTLRQTRGCGGSRIRISGTCAFPSMVARLLVLLVTHSRSGGGLDTSPTGWTPPRLLSTAPPWLPSHLPCPLSLANSRGIRDTDCANSSSPDKGEDRDWCGACGSV